MMDRVTARRAILIDGSGLNVPSLLEHPGLKLRRSEDDVPHGWSHKKDAMPRAVRTVTHGIAKSMHPTRARALSLRVPCMPSICRRNSHQNPWYSNGATP
jgi:hypothetical protein